MNKTLYGSLLALGALLLTSCSEDRVDEFFKGLIQAPASSIERDVKATSRSMPSMPSCA